MLPQLAAQVVGRVEGSPFHAPYTRDLPATRETVGTLTAEQIHALGLAEVARIRG